MKKIQTVDLTTEYENDLSVSEIPFSEYPRPHMRRDFYLCLNGKWQFSVSSGDSTERIGEITVPFPTESRISGIKREISENEILIYERTLKIDEDMLDGRMLLHVDACDQFSEVFVNGTSVGKGEGGYLPHVYDVTNQVKLGENHLRIEAHDPLDRDLPYGKQTDKRGGMWYTKVSGIWQTVWLERVPVDYIRELWCETDLTGVTINTIGGKEEKTVILDGRSYTFSGSRLRIDIDDPILWTPSNPHLYEFELISGEDRVRSYFGLRTVEIKSLENRPYICLNGHPIFCNGLLDQGYFSDGIFLPASPRAFEDDILKMRACGFNMLRKHIKLEPEIFYYYCDKYGMLVFQDMINSGKYSFTIDTALPTVFLKSGISHRATPRRREIFIRTSKAIIDKLRPHPSVIYYTIFNEGWGQFDADEMYRILKDHDPSRIYDTTSGWFKKKLSDVESDHVYFKRIKPKKNLKKPWVLSEFGGYAYRVDGHSFNLDKIYGYKKLDTREDFQNALEELYKRDILPAIDAGLSAAVLTQLSDVEDETNGMLTYDRKVLKIDENRSKLLSDILYSRFEKALEDTNV